MISEELAKLEAQGRPIRMGISGAGWLGSGYIKAISHVKGMRVDVVADPDIKLARQALINSGISADDIIEADTVAAASDTLKAGKKVVTGRYDLAAQLEAIDIVSDATPNPASGADTALSCIQHHKDVVMVNIEADATIGRVLKKMAEKEGVLYTVSSGDEPGCLMESWDYVITLGYMPIVIGKGKNNPLDPRATPDSVAESARKSAKDPYQVASYVDGTKTMFEMTCAANATGCRPQQRGMIGPMADLSSVSQIFALKEDGGMIEAPHTVDFVQGNAMSGGVFITVKIDDRRIQEDLAYLKVGKGYYYTFFRPYHLWFLEAPISVARAYLYRQTTLVAQDVPVAEAITTAKRDLTPGDKLDTFGGYTFYGQIERAEEAKRLNALPVGLAPQAVVVKSVKAGEIITYDDVMLDEGQTVVKLRREQDKMESAQV
jgi:predicted homoserine dehydrogenase-like protein